MRAIVGLIFLSSWIFGIILAKGFWSTFFAVVMPIWAYYLTIEHFAIIYKLI